MEDIFNGIVQRHSLLKHPFYLAWNEGKLEKKQLALYAREYGAFIQLIAMGWKIVGETMIAAEEERHFRMWQGFARSVGVEKIGASLPETRKLIEETGLNYQTMAETLGVLYAFESQQPLTAASKLKGLREHYGHWTVDESYFMVHEDDWSEPALLLRKIMKLNGGGRDDASGALASTCTALWETLSGIMERS